MALPPSSKYLQRSADPVDDAERESITARLNGAFEDGRINHDEYAGAMDVVYDARTLGELVPVVERLPAPQNDTPAIVAQAGPPAGDVTESRNLLPLAIGAGVVGVTLIAVLLLLVVMLFI